MRIPRPTLVPALVAFVVLSAGCTSPSPDEETGEGSVTTITDPNQGRLDPTMGDHVHDYWGSRKELVIVDEVVEVGGIIWGGDSIPVAEVRPASGDVVPQGASEVRVFIAWTDEASDNNYDRAELWVKRANESQPASVGEVQSGTTVSVPTGNESNDLPHQLLSAWVFQLVLFGQAELGELFNVSYSGDVTLSATAVRGDDPIPLFPGHPDQWQGRTEIPLLEFTGNMAFDGNTETGNWRCYGGCPFYMVPDDGAIVPIDADHVTVVIERENPANPMRLGIKFHSSLTRDFEVPAEMEETLTTRTYTIPVLDGGDGPYAKQSQWEFLFYASDPQEDVAVVEDFTLTITVHKGP